MQLLVHYRPAPSPRLAAVRDFIALRFDGALFYPEGLLSFVLPLWLTLPVASWVLNDGLNLRFVTIWSVFTLIMLCGRFILLSWFDEGGGGISKTSC